eukprot:239492_1
MALENMQTTATICFILLLNVVNSVTTYYVDPSVSNAGNGQSWSTAYADLSSALAAASSGNQIWLKGGETYIAPTSHRDHCFSVNQGVVIYGGFRGTESSINGRVTSDSLKSVYETIISGDIGTRHKASDNCYHVLTFSGTIILNRVTISDGNADLEYDPSDPDSRYILNGYGGALITDDILQAQAVFLDEVTFESNTAIAGGALWFGASKTNTVQITIRNSKFIANTAINGVYEGGYGGAIYSYFGVSLTVSNTDFSHNRAAFRGGAMYQDYAAQLVCGSCNLFNNTAKGYGGAVFIEERFEKAQTNARFTAARFEQNNALVLGGAIALFGHNVSATISGALEECSANYGGAQANVFGSIQYGGGIAYSSNIAWEEPATHDEYHETEELFDSVNDALEFEIDVILIDIWDLYQRKQEQIDLYPPGDTGLCYVNIDNDLLLIAQNGNSWSTAYSALQDCLDELETSGGEIWVRYGTYKPTTIPLIKPGLRVTDQSFTLYDNVQLYGGFSGDETRREDRNIAENPTYLSGAVTVLSQVINLVFAVDVSGVVIDGFVLEAAGCTEDDLRAGGGIYAVRTNIVIVNSIFHKLCSRTHGGAIFSFGKSDNEASLTSSIMNTVFIGNTASYNGGAIFASGDSYFTCKWCDFWDNSASRIGGAIYLWQDTFAYFESSSFIRNYAANSGGCVAVEDDAKAIFDCGKFYNNSARWEGGCLYAGFGDDIQDNPEPNARHEHVFQGFEDWGPSNFVDNYLSNKDTYDRGQPDVYLWPYTQYVVHDKDCGGSGSQPTPPPATTPTTPAPIQCGDIVSGLYANQPLSFPFTLPSDYLVTIRTCLSSFNTFLRLWKEGPGEDQVWLDDDSCPTNDNALLISHLFPGQYTIELTAARATPRGTFTMMIVCREIVTTTLEPTFTTLEPSLPPTNPGRICCGETKTGEYNNVEIWMPLDLNDALKVIFTSCASKFDTRIELYDESRQFNLGIDENGCGNGRAQLEMELLLPGRYYVRLSAGLALSEEDVFSEFTFGMICIPPPTVPEVKQHIECLETKVGVWSGDAIIFEFDLRRLADEVIIATCGSQFNTKLTLMDDTLTEVIDSCDNCGIGGSDRADCDAGQPNVCCIGNPLNSQLIVDIAPGRYYIILDAPLPVASDVTQYVLSLECPGGAPGIQPTPSPTPPGIFYCNEGNSGQYNDETIIIPFELEEHYGVSSVDFIACNSNFDTIVYLYDIFGNLMGWDNDGCDGSLQSLLEMTALVPGMYKFHLSSPEEDVFGLYSFNIACTPLLPTPNITPAPSRPPAIECFETLTGEYNNKEILFQFDLEFAALVRFSSCGSDFNTKIALKDAELEVIRDQCINCGVGGSFGDCSLKLGEICCDGNGPFQSELELAMTPGRYYWSLDHVDEGQDIFASFEVSLDCVGVPTAPTTSSPTPAPTPAPSPAPTPAPTPTPIAPDVPLWPTRRPDYSAPGQCTDRCDAFSVSVVDWDLSNDDNTICITYNVERMMSSGYYCYQPVQYLVLGVCDGDSIMDNPMRGCSKSDLNGLLESFTIINMGGMGDSDDSDDSDSGDSGSDDSDSSDSDSDSSDRRRRLGSSSYSKQAFGAMSESVYGIMIAQPIEDSATFKICLRNVFDTDNIEFSNNVRFRRGYNRFTCNDEWVVGLPCLDADRFTHGMYGNEGYNSYGGQYRKYYKRRRHRVEGVNQMQMDDINDAFQTSNIVRWEVLSCICLVALCACGIIAYVVIVKKKRLNLSQNIRKDRVSTYDADMDSDSESRVQCVPPVNGDDTEGDELEMQETRRLVGE